MKRYLLTIILTIFHVGVLVHAQGRMEIQSMVHDQGDMTARVNPVKDNEGKNCALIRVVTNLTNLEFSADALGIVKTEKETGAYKLWVPAGARTLVLKADGYGQKSINYYNDYQLRIEAANVYVLTVEGVGGAPVVSGDTTVVPTYRMTLNVSPSHARVFLDDNVLIANVPGVYNRDLKAGQYSYRIEADEYETETGTITIENQNVSNTIKLKPKFGILEIITQPEDSMEVRIDGEFVGVSPLQTRHLRPGRHNIGVTKEFYLPLDTTILVHPQGLDPQQHIFKLIDTRKPEQRRTLVMLSAGVGASQFSFGAMVGMVKKYGGYIHFLSDFGSASTDLDCDDSNALEGEDGIPYYTGTSKKARLSVTAGYLHRFGKKSPLYGYIGAGYGTRTLAWELVDGTLAKNKDHSAAGVAAELGVIARFSSFAFSAGYQTVMGKYHELNVGIGVMF